MFKSYSSSILFAYFPTNTFTHRRPKILPFMNIIITYHNKTLLELTNSRFFVTHQCAGVLMARALTHQTNFAVKILRPLILRKLWFYAGLLRGVRPWKFRNHDFEIVVGPKGPPSGPTFRGARGGHAHFLSKSRIFQYLKIQINIYLMVIPI